MPETRAPRIYSRRKGAEPIPPGAVYVGRPSKWGNEFVLLQNATEEEREHAIAEHRISLMLRLQREPHLLDELRGKDLVCWCAPLPCHAETLLTLANLPPAQQWWKWIQYRMAEKL